MKPRLLAISGSLTGTVRELSDSPISVGRLEENQLCLTDPAVSRNHCTIQPIDGQNNQGQNSQYELVDLDSRSGTFVNGLPVLRRSLDHGDTIRIGSASFLYLTHEDETGPPRRRASDLSSNSSLETKRVALPAIEIGRMARDLTALFRISSVINSIRDSQLLQRELLQLIFEVVPADEGAVVLITDLDEETFETCTWNRHTDSPSKISISKELVHRAFWEQAAVQINAQIDDDPSAGEQQNILCQPLVAIERTIGVLYLTSLPPAPPFGEDHVYFLDSASRIAAVTLENILALDSLRSENSKLKRQLNTATNLVGESRQIRQVSDFISRVAQSDSTVLIRGESGTGKEVIARSIHQSSPRSELPFIAINCAAIPETLLESELFGHEKGAYTGALGMRKGKLEAAEDGTLFLDEIGELAPPMQAKLLRVLQQREFERVGGTHSVAFKARVLAATNKNLELAIKSNEFRQDLYYRLNVVSISVPPLREHSEDIPLLALYFASKYAQKNKRPFKGIASEARSLLLGYSWPGNVRELENAIEHAIVLGLTEEILAEDLPTIILEQQSAKLAGGKYHDVLNESKKEMILNALHDSKGSYPEAARTLGIHPKYLHRLARNLNLKSDPP
ncbi:sigma 54-interacting transcriptional regulator [Tunturibacter empetritectus]|uniref:Nif-specific regulatory protein n=1 Tax=Tunturiibacter lichenicola TaxID=2051959 RepID=A0A7W8N325_9BACT|nr:sigma 54-interacting transcriptional regulator [Edaphobacter lichenicola]MBB5344012.1 Nif-specific regulatory protein [Edaphobacter lichenicola]